MDAYETWLILLGPPSAAALLLWPELCLALLFGVTTLVNPSVRIGPLGVYASALLTCVFSLAVLVRRVVDRRWDGRPSALDRPFAALFAMFALNYLAMGSGTGSFKRLLALGIVAVGYLGTSRYVREGAAFRRVLRWLAAGGVLAGAMGIYTYYVNPFGGAEAQRAQGAFGNPNSLAHFLVVAAPVLLALTVLHKDRLGRWILWAGGVVCLLGLVRTHSRGGFAGVAVMPLAATGLAGRRLAVSVSLVVGLVAAGYLHIISATGQESAVVDLAQYIMNAGRMAQQDRIYLWATPDVAVAYEQVDWQDLDGFKTIPTSFRARTIIWGQAWDRFVEQPVFGAGLGNCMYSAVPYDSRSFDNAFNIWISLLAETGIVGCGLFVWFLLRVGSLCVGLIRTAATRETAWVAFALGAAYLGHLAHSTVEDTWYSIMTNWILGILLGLVAEASGALGLATAGGLAPSRDTVLSFSGRERRSGADAGGARGGARA